MRALFCLSLALFVGCDAAPVAPEPADACPFPVSEFAQAPLLFNPAPGDTLRVGERFFLSAAYNGQRPGGNHALAAGWSFRLIWTPAGSEPQVLYEWPGAQGAMAPTARFIVEVMTPLELVDGSPSVAQLDAGEVAFEAAVEVESVACGGADRTSLVTRHRVVVE
ncbi:hypothetical protein [Rubrivirga sp. IMCC45206]|uniref:hypothetical protein n=1 Tax=Rubrivirga sp. IMCC45206 TaxID=3391614 RepID=UPI00398FB1CC